MAIHMSFIFYVWRSILMLIYLKLHFIGFLSGFRVESDIGVSVTVSVEFSTRFDCCPFASYFLYGTPLGAVA